LLVGCLLAKSSHATLSQSPPSLDAPPGQDWLGYALVACIAPAANHDKTVQSEF